MATSSTCVGASSELITTREADDITLIPSSELVVEKKSLVPTLEVFETINTDVNVAHNDELSKNENDELNSSPVKIFKFGIRAAKPIRYRSEDEKTTINPAAKQELILELFRVLKKYFKYAFTIIVQKKKLSPSDAFQTTRKFGITVPKFIHPSSLEYVEEVSKKVVLFMHRNVSEGCAMHIMIEKNKTSYVVQRFVFRTNGTVLDVPNDLDNDGGELQYLDIDDIKAHCKTSLLHLQSTDAIKPMVAPQYSRWSISIGLKQELVSEDEALFSCDPSGNYFPWKKRLKSLANIEKTGNDSLVSDGFSINGSTNLSQPNISEEGTSDTKVANEKTLPCQQGMESSQLKNNTSTHEANSSSAYATDESVVNPVSINKPCGIICFPLSSFPITSNSMLSVYGLEYAAPVNNRHSPSVTPKTGSNFKPRHKLRQSGSKSSRLSLKFGI